MIIDVLDRFLPIIQKHYPNTLKDSIVFYDDGHDHYVFVVNHTHAFRIPRTEAYGKNDQVENVFLKQLTKTSPIKVQIMTGQVDKYTGIQYQTYEFIPGIRLSRELAATLTQEELVLIAKDIARFLIHLHSFPIEQAKEMKMDTLISAQDYGQYFKSDLERNKAVIFPILTQEERRWIEQLVIDFVALTEKNPFELKVIHSDMLPEHIIIDEKVIY